jgi:ABC-type multidrug transport system fused ATPase/permease subunit
MTTQEKRPIVFLVIDIATFLNYYALLLYKSNSRVDNLGELSFWGTSILLLVPIMILSRISLYLLYSILNSVITKKREEKFLTDEFGELIKLRASRNFSNTFMLGFLLTMGLLILGISITTMFKLFFFSVLAAFIVQNISEFYFTRKGI